MIEGQRINSNDSNDGQVWGQSMEHGQHSDDDEHHENYRFTGGTKGDHLDKVGRPEDVGSPSGTKSSFTRQSKMQSSMRRSG